MVRSSTRTPDSSPFASPLQRGTPPVFYPEPLRSGRLATASLVAGLLSVAWPIAITVMAFTPATTFIVWASVVSGIAIAVEGVLCSTAICSAALALIKIREGTGSDRAAALGGLTCGALALAVLGAAAFYLYVG